MYRIQWANRLVRRLSHMPTLSAVSGEPPIYTDWRFSYNRDETVGWHMLLGRYTRFVFRDDKNETAVVVP